MSQAQVTLERDGRTVSVTLDRPEARNLVTRAMMLELLDALGEARSADIVVLGASGEDFCLGRDQSEKPEGVSPEDNLRLILEANRRLRELAGVSVALVRGRALGFGSGLAMQCDLVLAADTAVLGFDEIAHGFPPLLVQSYLTDHLPRKAAVDLVLTGRLVPAREARELGMVTRVVPAAHLDAAGAALVDHLSRLDARALRRAKRFFAEIGAVPAPERSEHALQTLVGWREEAAATGRSSMLTQDRNPGI